MKVAIVYNKEKIESGDVINVFGAATQEHYSRDTVEKVARALERGGHTVKVVEGGMRFIDDLRDFMPRVVAGERPGMVFNMAYGIQGRNRYTHVPAMLEMLGIPYVGSGPEAHAVVQDKALTKMVLQKNGIPTPRSWVFSSAGDDFADLEFPVIVKPKMESTSMGMDVVRDVGGLRRSVAAQIERYSQDILVEQFVAGREFAVGIVGNGPHTEVLPIVELDLGGDPNRIQTASDKLENPVRKVCPAPLPDGDAARMRSMCADAYARLGLNDFTRVDLRMDESGRMYVLELNSLASLGTTGSLYRAAQAAGYDYDSLVNRILDAAALRYFGESQLHRPGAGGARGRGGAGGGAAGQAHPPLHASLRSYLRTHYPTSEKMLEHLVDINSSAGNVDDVNRVGSAVSRRLEHAGFAAQVYREFDVGNAVYLSNHDGSADSDVLILGHLDTPYSNRDFAPFRRAGNRLYGSGAAESKGGLVVAVSALQALRFVRRLRGARVGVLLVGDDSLGGRFSRKIVRDTAAASRAVLDVKWGMDGGGVAVSCSGTARYHVDMTHAHTRGRDYADIVPAMCRRVAALGRIAPGTSGTGGGAAGSGPHSAAPDIRGSGVSVSEFRATSSFGREPDYGVLSLASRYATEEEGAALEAEMWRIARKRDGARLDVHISRQSSRSPVAASAETESLYSVVREEAASADMRIDGMHRRASSGLGDVGRVMPMVGSMGPVGVGVRTPDEHILADSLIDRAVLLALVVHRLAADRRRGEGDGKGAASASASASDGSDGGGSGRPAAGGQGPR